MPIVVDGSAAAVTTPLIDSGQISFLRAKQLVARAIGDVTDETLLDEAGDLILASLEELSLHHWEFLLKTAATIAVVAGTADYELPSDCQKPYTARLGTNQRPLAYAEQRDYDRIVTVVTTGTPTHFTMFPGTVATGATPQHSKTTIRLIPTPTSTDTLILKYYRPLGIINDDGDTLDLPRRYQYWPIYQAKAMMLSDHGGNEDRIAYWQGKADRLLMQMKSDDQEHPDRDLGFSTARDRVGAYDLTHPYAALLALDGW